MGKIQPFSIGERVTRKSYNHDVLFRVASVKQEYAFLHGEDIRLIADAPMSDLQIIEERELKKRQEREKEKEEYSYRLFRQDYQLMKEKRDYISSNGYNYENFFQIPPRVLHLDGDVSYLKKCIKYYDFKLKMVLIFIQLSKFPFKILFTPFFIKNFNFI